MSLNPRQRDWQEQVVWLIGASTGIGAALGEALHARGARVAVSARAADKLADFERRHAGSLALPADVLDAAQLRQALQQLLARWGRVDWVVYCAGSYTPMRADDFDLASASAQLQTNYQGALNLLAPLLPQLLAQGAGHLSLVSSVAGYRGLPKALGYGPAKAALINLAETLYLDLQPRGIGVSLVCPGFVETPMTAQNEFRMPALQTPAQAAAAIIEGWADGDFEIHFPKRFTRLMKLLKYLPYRLYFRVVRRGTRT
jgi:NAD(P)-dependent dehydrogenase (short-subunit alcohol dehydrogenase family)